MGGNQVKIIYLCLIILSYEGDDSSFPLIKRLRLHRSSSSIFKMMRKEIVTVKRNEES